VVLGLPFSIVLITIIYLVLVKSMFSAKGFVFKISHEIIGTALKKLGIAVFIFGCFLN
jgi:sodium-dependent dicarboxylate transporter 2/3/5